MKSRTLTRCMAVAITGILATDSCWSQSFMFKSFSLAGDDAGKDISVDPDGTIRVLAQTSSTGAGNSDILVLTLDENGELLTNATIGRSERELAYSAKRLEDGTLAIAAKTRTTAGGADDMLVFKTSATGDQVIAKRVIGNSGAGGANDENTSDLLLHEDHIYVLGAVISAPFVVLKLDTALQTAWASSVVITATRSVAGRIIHDPATGGFYCSGTVQQTGPTEMRPVLFHLDASGALDWGRMYNDSAIGTEVEAMPALVRADDGSLYFAQTVEYGSDSEILLAKVDAMGNVLWAKRLGGAGAESVGSMIWSDGSLLLAGSSTSFSAGDTDALLMRLAPDGTVQWAHAYGGVSEESLNSIHAVSDGSGVDVIWGCGTQQATASSDFDILILKVNADGGGFFDCTEFDVPIVVQDVTMTDAAMGTSNTYNVYSDHSFVTGTATWSENIECYGVSSVEEVVAPVVVASPNPTTGLVNLGIEGARSLDRVSIVDATGRCVETSYFVANKDALVVDLKSQSNGLYLVRVRFTDGTFAVARVVKE